ncbi:MAG: hypothetical protein JW873_02000 [Candidatus Saganbacteria bacterium]|nr:hypothetical protein [Candidatus Saganbacteria bacterium]
MKIGIAKETVPGEVRVVILPAEVEKIVKAGHQVFVEKNAGRGVYAFDEDYIKAGAEVMEDPAEIYNKDIVAKLKAPSPPEFQLLKIKDNIVLSMFHHQQQPWNIDMLKAANSVVVALEMLRNEAGERLVNCNRMTGQQGMLYAFQQSPKVPEECSVLMLGYGEVATGALQVAFALGANVKILRRSEYANLEHFIRDKDIVVNAIKWPNEKREKKEYLITRPLLGLLSRGAIILDLAVDQPGPIETTRPTSLAEPFFIEEGVKHICVYGYPSLSPVSSSRRYSRQITAVLLEIAAKGLPQAPEYIKRAVVKA